MSDNTALIQDLFASIAEEGWSTKFNDALADDLVWVATGSSPVAGTYKGKQLYLEKDRLKGNVAVVPAINVLPLEDAARAHQLIETGHVRGKLVLKIAEV
jgi:ketosteroid isomerase-like protein